MYYRSLLIWLLASFVFAAATPVTLSADPPMCKHFYGVCGDANDDSQISITDAVYLINFIFAGGPAPANYWAGDCNLDGLLSISDVVYLLNYIFVAGSPPCAGGGGRALDSPFLDCLEYSFDGALNLNMHHVNTAFNCCPQDITIEAYKVGFDIYIVEEEIPNPAGPCPCMCLFDLSITIPGLPPGEYRIVVDEPYLPPGEPQLDFTVDLNWPVTNRVCVFRDFYPWGNPWKK